MMDSKFRLSQSVLVPVVAMCMVLVSAQAFAQEGAMTPLEADAHAAVKKLMETSPAAKDLLSNAKGVLIFPNIVKAGFLVGAKYGDGALLEGNAQSGFNATEYYNIAAASYGLQAGVQSFGFAMVLMTDKAVRYVESRTGFELGAGPSIVVVDAGVAKTLTTATAKSNVYAFTFGQKGLMGGLGLEGTKVTKLNK